MKIPPLRSFAKHVATSADSSLTGVLEKLVKTEVKSPNARRILSDLRAGKLVKPAAERAIKRFEEMLQRLPKLAEELQFRRREFSHVFHVSGDELGTARLDALRTEYLRMCDEMREFARTEDFQKLISNPSSRAQIEKYAGDQMQSLSGIVDRYGDLYRETYTVNALTRRLFPGKTMASAQGKTIEGSAIYLGLRLDAQHIVEKRVLPKWEEDWALLGWKSEADMPAVPIMHEWHIPSPKNLMGLEGRKLLDEAETPIEDVFSLTKEMERDLPLEKFKSADEYLSALKKFCNISVKNKRGDVVEPLRNLVTFVGEVEKELDRARTNAALVKAVRQLRGK